MSDLFLEMEHLDAYLVGGILVVFGLLEIAAGYLSRSKRSFSDWIQEAGGFLMLVTFIKPAILLVSVALLGWAAPTLYNALGHLNFFALFLLFVLGDDFLQYWYHRMAHETPFLWKLHRPHHQAEEMGFFVSYRNAGLYYLLMPNIWWIGLLTYLGAGPAIALGLVVKQVVIVSSHSRIHWDAPFYGSKILRPIVLFLERIIVTPAFHHAHHGRSQADGISDPNGNFGNMLSVWDQLFGSAYYTHQFPESYGLIKPTDDHWSAAYLYPLIHSKDPGSNLSRVYSDASTAVAEPALVSLEKGKKYLYCRCGKSKNQPYCDGSHHGTRHKPLLFEAKKSGAVKLCNCKLTKSGPFCDNSHVAFSTENV